MRKLSRGVKLLVLGAIVSGCLSNSSTSTRSARDKTVGIGKVAPDATGVDSSGQAFKLSDSRGKVVLLDFWAEF